MIHRQLLFFTLISIFMILINCSGEKDGPGSFVEASEKLAESMQEIGESMQDNSDIEPVHCSELENLFPETVGAFTRVTKDGKNTKTMGINVSEAKATYKALTDRRMEIRITDMGNMSGLTAMTAAAWTFKDYDSHRDDGYEKTTTIEDCKALEKYNKAEREGKLSILVGKRFVVEVEGNDIDLDELKGFVDTINLAALKRMAKEQNN